MPMKSPRLRLPKQPQWYPCLAEYSHSHISRHVAESGGDVTGCYMFFRHPATEMGSIYTIVAPAHGLSDSLH